MAYLVALFSFLRYSTTVNIAQRQFSSKMKRVSLLSAILLICLLFGLFLLYVAFPSSKKLPIYPSLSPTLTQSKKCTPSAMEPIYTLEGAAGNIYGTFLLRNISGVSCELPGNVPLTIGVPEAYSIYISPVPFDTPKQETFHLNPNQTLYAQIHYPNGPQCQSGIVSIPVSYFYPVSSTEALTFQNTRDPSQHTINVCKDPNEKTKVDVWYFSDKPISPQQLKIK